VDTIQCLAFNPVTQVLVTCSSSDFGFEFASKNIPFSLNCNARVLAPREAVCQQDPHAFPPLLCQVRVFVSLHFAFLLHFFISSSFATVGRNDGQYFALGLFSGIVNIYNKV
jgi:hypothetical protein